MRAPGARRGAEFVLIFIQRSRPSQRGFARQGLPLLRNTVDDIR